jgi:long-chain acyl-CoA synthetase
VWPSVQDPEATAKVLDLDGWFETGDLGWLAPATKAWAARNCQDVLVMEGRSKDTIVMSTGKSAKPGLSYGTFCAGEPLRFF